MYIKKYIFSLQVNSLPKNPSPYVLLFPSTSLTSKLLNSLSSSPPHDTLSLPSNDPIVRAATIADHLPSNDIFLSHSPSYGKFG